jgi:peptidoglycan hydrolase-like protein with peptidoglycan-binding domain
MSSRAQAKSQISVKTSTMPSVSNPVQCPFTHQRGFSPTSAQEPPVVAKVGAVHRAPAGIQAKLTVGQPGDRYEQEADRVAEAVMRMPEPAVEGGPPDRATKEPPGIQRCCPECEEEILRQPKEEEEEEKIHRKRGGASRAPAVTPGLQARISGLRGAGQPLSQSDRAFFEPRFGYDFSRVRIHADSRAADTAKALDARAYTVGNDIFLGQGQYDPGFGTGRSLLAHELTHVIQQCDRLQSDVLQRQVGVGRDLKSARFSGDPILERVLDDRIEIGNTPGRVRTGRAVRLIQESLMEQGYALPLFGADSVYGDETEAAVLQFQIDAGAVLLDGIVGDETLGLLDMHDRGATAGVNLTAARFAGNAVLEQVLDGNRLLRIGSRGNAVQLIEESLVAMGINVGPTGPDPNYDADTETAVEQFQGRVGALVDGIVGAETMAFFDEHDPGGTAGAGVATGAVFSESVDEEFAGYDDSVAPNWLVVPLGGRRRPDVAITPAGARPSYVSDTPTVATVQSTEEGAVVTGIAHGTARVQARQGAAVLDSLNIDVKNRLDRSVAFHYVCDSRPAAAGGPNCSNGTPSADDMRSLLNRVWERQANVRFTGGASQNLAVPGDLGPYVNDNGFGGDEMGTVTALGAAADYRVFRVNHFRVNHALVNDAANNANNTMIGDTPCADGLGLPHEAGHFLGLNHPDGFIMTPCPGARDRRVSRNMANRVNP